MSTLSSPPREREHCLFPAGLCGFGQVGVSVRSSEHPPGYSDSRGGLAGRVAWSLPRVLPETALCLPSRGGARRAGGSRPGQRLAELEWEVRPHRAGAVHTTARTVHARAGRFGENGEAALTAWIVVATPFLRVAVCSKPEVGLLGVSGPQPRLHNPGQHPLLVLPVCSPAAPPGIWLLRNLDVLCAARHCCVCSKEKRDRCHFFLFSVVSWVLYMCNSARLHVC